MAEYVHDVARALAAEFDHEMTDVRSREMSVREDTDAVLHVVEATVESDALAPAVRRGLEFAVNEFARQHGLAVDRAETPAEVTYQFYPSPDIDWPTTA